MTDESTTNAEAPVMPTLRMSRPMNKTAVAIVAIIGATLVLLTLASAVIPTRADASSQSQAASVPRCWEDQVIAQHGRCLAADDRTTRFHPVTPAGRGYWYDTRYPSALRLVPVVPACYRHQMVTRYGGCVAISLGDFRGIAGSPRGWWYVR